MTKQWNLVLSMWKWRVNFFIRRVHVLTSIYQPTYAPCDTPFMTYQLLHVSAQRCHPHGVIITKIYKPNANLVFVSPCRRTTWGIRGIIIKFANLILGGLFITNLYQLDNQSTKFTIWKYWKGCVKKLGGNDPNFLPTTHGSCVTTMHLLTRHCLWGSF